ncbi:MAG: trehalose-phosphatase [Woeseiaceae bacterium]
MVRYRGRMLPHPPQIDAHTSALFLDVDGTLLELEEYPEDVRADLKLLDMLSAIAEKLGGALALVSGRSLKEIDRIFYPKIFAASGEHGAETRDDRGCILTIPGTPIDALITEDVVAFARTNELLLENKQHGIALHYRQNPEFEDACRRLMQSVLAELPEEYRLIDGKMVFEITRRVHNKGDAVKTLLDMAPFHGRSPIYVGDDVTDEDGFKAANDLAGTSVRIGQSDSTVARYAIDDVSTARAWLSQTIHAETH